MSTPLLKNLFISSANALINSAKSVGERLSPCLTPLFAKNHPLNILFTLTQADVFPYKA